MNGLDVRTVLEVGCELILDGECFRVKNVIGRGGSCIVYSVTKEIRGGQSKIGFFERSQIIKEFYPAGLAGLSRNASNIVVPESAAKDFHDRKSQFIKGVFMFGECYEIAPAKVLPRPFKFIDGVNGTAYAVSDPSYGEVLSDCDPFGFSLYQIAQIMYSLFDIAERFHEHEPKLLYLDFKPDNIFHREIDGHKHIALFDFDTVIPLDDLRAQKYEFITCSEGWTPPEQERQSVSEISTASDIYSLGAVFFWLLTGRKPASVKGEDGSDSDIEALSGGRFDLRNESPVCADATDIAVSAALSILQSTLQESPYNRKSIKDIKALLDNIFGGTYGENEHGAKALMGRIDVMGAEVISAISNLSNSQSASFNIIEDNYSPVNAIFEEMVDREGLVDLIDSKLVNGAPQYIYATRGIGKTTLAKAYCNSDYARQYNYIFWISAKSLDIRLDIMGEPVFRFSRLSDDDSDIDILFKHFILQNKMPDKSVLLVIDGVEYEEQIDAIETFLPQLRWKILVTTRYFRREVYIENKTIKLCRLEKQFCEELFYSHFDGANRENDTKDLFDLFTILDYNTYMICLFAKQGYDMDYSVRELYEMLKDSDASNDMQTFFLDAVRKLFDASTLDSKEQLILSYFSLLPSIPILEDVLLKWFSFPDVDLKKLFRSLHKKGWLLFTKSSNEVYFQCHSLVTSAMKNHPEVAPEDFGRIVRNIEDFLKVPMSEMRGAWGMIQYFDCIDSILRFCGENDPAYFGILMNYIQLRNVLVFSPGKTYELALSLRSSAKKAYDEQGEKSLEKKTELLKIELIYLFALNNSSLSGKNKLLDELYSAAFSFAKSFLDEHDLLLLRVKRLLAMGARANGNLSMSVDLFNQILDKMEAIEMDSEWTYFYINVLQALGLSYSGLYRSEDDINLKKHYIGLTRIVRERAKDAALSIWDKDNGGMRAIYNDLGMAYLHSYDIEQNPGFLEQARKLLMLSYDMKRRQLGLNSSSTALAMANLSNLFVRLREYDDALEWLNSALDIYSKVYDGDNHRYVMQSVHLLADVFYIKYEKSKNADELISAARSAERAMNIGMSLYGGNAEHYIIREIVKLQEKIDAALKIAGIEKGE